MPAGSYTVPGWPGSSVISKRHVGYPCWISLVHINKSHFELLCVPRDRRISTRVRVGVATHLSCILNAANTESVSAACNKFLLPFLYANLEY